MKGVDDLDFFIGDDNRKTYMQQRYIFMICLNINDILFQKISSFSNFVLQLQD